MTEKLISVAMTRDAWDEVLMRYSDSVADQCVGRDERQAAEQVVLPIKTALDPTTVLKASMQAYQRLESPIGDLTHQIMKQLFVWKEALVRRMLCHWDPAWGMPVLVEGPSNARVPLYDSVRMPTSASISVLGLAETEFDDDGIARNVIKVRAAEHLGADNVPLPPEGPFPLPDNAQWERWRRAEEDIEAFSNELDRQAQEIIDRRMASEAIFQSAGEAVGPRVHAPCARAQYCQAYQTGINTGRSYHTCAAVGCPELSRLSVATACLMGGQCRASHRVVDGRQFLVCDMPDCPTSANGFEGRRRSLRKP